ncbi:unnamed protein product [Candida parapsilosis]
MAKHKYHKYHKYHEYHKYHKYHEYHKYHKQISSLISPYTTVKNGIFQRLFSNPLKDAYPSFDKDYRLTLYS